MKKRLIALILLLALLLTGCGYVAVEDTQRRTLGSLLFPAAYAEGEGLAEETETANATEEEGSRTETQASFSEPQKLEIGAKGDEVKELQALLIRLGFMNGSADGVYGAKTESGVALARAYVQAVEARAKAERQAALRETLAPVEAAALQALNALVPAEGSPITAKQAGFTFLTLTGETEETSEEISAERVLNFLREELPAYVGDLKYGAERGDIRRLQTRLVGKNYLPGGIDGQYGANTKAAVRYFQRENKLKETGVADEETQLRLFSEDCKAAQRPSHKYRVEINVSRQKVYVYEWYYGAYSKLVKTMTCTTGAVDTPTPLGSYRMGGPCGRWYYFKKFDCWAQYASRIVGGILFHSVLYSEKDESTLRRGSVYALGTRGSHGCVRLAVEDAKWLYNNVSAGSTCRVYA